MCALHDVCCVSSTQISAQEAAWFLLGYKYVFNTSQIVAVNVLYTHESSYYKLKTKAQLSKQDQNDKELFTEQDRRDKGILQYLHLKNDLNSGQCGLVV